MFRYPLIAIALFAGAGGLAQAQAQDQAPQPNVRADIVKALDQNFGKGDVNNDGFLSRTEVQTMTAKAAQQVIERMEKEFAQLDKDKNGQVSLAEFKAGATARFAGTSEATLQRLDSNKDGKVSPAEFKTPTLTAFDRADSNKDGRLTPDEAKKAVGRQ